MRDKNRIDAFCLRLAEAWKNVPDWRFGQLVCNLQRANGNDMFYVEDDKAIELIESYLRGY